MNIAVSVRQLIYEVPQKRVLNSVNLDVHEGEILSIMGQSGSGKTTLLKLMTGLLRPTSGQILVDGRDIAALNESEMDAVRLKMGLVFQYAALFDSLSVYDNILFGVVRRRHQKGKQRASRSELDKKVTELLAEVGLPGIEQLMPAELSGGMQKRVGLARALAMEPSIVYYDEPTSGLDPVSAYTIDDLIVSTTRRAGVTSVVVSHDLGSIFRISDRVAMLDQGKIVICSPPAEVQASPIPVVQAFIHPERSHGHSPDA